MKLFYIYWIDSESADGWDKHTNPKKPLYVHSIGWFLDEDKNYFTIVADLDLDNGNQNRKMAIPKVCIIKKRQIPCKLGKQ